MVINQVLKKVEQFQLVFNHPMAKYPYLPNNMELRNLRVNILREEYEEYLKAEEDNDIVEVADALVDMAYIIYGTSLVYGIPLDDKVTFSYSVNNNPQFPDVDNLRPSRIAMMKSVFEDYLRAESDDELSYIKNSLRAMLDVIFETAYLYNIPFDIIFDEVHRSNMSKLGEDGNPVYREDGKILKGPNYFRPDIKGIFQKLWDNV